MWIKLKVLFSATFIFHGRKTEDKLSCFTPAANEHLTVKVCEGGVCQRGSADISLSVSCWWDRMQLTPFCLMLCEYKL